MNSANETGNWLSLIEQHIARYPAMTARDVYKLLYQGVMGPEHVMPSAEVFTGWLEDELAGLQPDAEEALLESIRPDGRLQRIHLRRWLATGRALSELAEACLETGRRVWGDKDGLHCQWIWFLDQVEEGGFPTIDAAEARSLDSWLNEDDFPAAHHSPAYEAEYHPAYRLVSAGLIPTGHADGVR